MILKVKGSTQNTERINYNIINKLYDLVYSANDRTNWEIEGATSIDYIYQKWVDYLENLYNRYSCTVNREFLIWFDDKEVESVLINNLGLNVNGVPISYKVDLSSLRTNNTNWFQNNTNIKTFNELELFKNITSLYDQTFRNCSELEEINLSNIQTIGDYCFENNTKLKSDINIPNLTRLNRYAFQNCSSITTVSDLGVITSIMTNTFYGCTNLQSVVLPETITVLGSGSFYNCTSLSSINIPESLTEIKSNAFRNTAITEINLSNITIIEDNAFRDCKSLISDIDIPNLTDLRGRAFYNCTSIKKVTNLGNVTSLGTVTEGGVAIGVFTSCTSLEEVHLPTSLRTIKHTFSQCPNLKTITGNPSLTEIGERSFEGCDKLETNILNQNIMSIGERAFVKCLKLNLTEINLPNLQTLGASVFAGCQKLERVISLGNTITALSWVHSNWDSYGRVGMFTYCINLTDVNLPDTITALGKYTFDGCTKLSNINIPNSLSTLGDNCFSNCPALINNILYFKNVTTIGNLIFSASIVNQLYFPSITSLYDGYWTNAVYTNGSFGTQNGSSRSFQCNLLYLKLDYDVMTENNNYIMSDGTFTRANVINLVINNEIPPQLEEYTFPSGTFNITNIWVPDSAVNTYKTTQYWSVLSSKIKSINNYPFVVDTYAEYETLRNNGDNNIYLIREYMN